MTVMSPGSGKSLPISKRNCFGVDAKMLRSMRNEKNVNSLEEMLYAWGGRLKRPTFSGTRRLIVCNGLWICDAIVHGPDRTDGLALSLSKNWKGTTRVLTSLLKIFI